MGLKPEITDVHASKHGTAIPAGDEWGPMGWHFHELSSIDPFVIDQTVTAGFGNGPRPWARDLIGSLADALTEDGA